MSRSLRLLFYCYLVAAFMILAQAGSVYAYSNSISPPFKGFSSYPASGTCSVGGGLLYYVKTCASNNLQYGYDFLYVDGSSPCDDFSCVSIHPSAYGFFNPSGPYAKATVPSGTIVLGFGEAITAYGKLQSDANSAGYASSQWVVKYCDTIFCQHTWTRNYGIVFVQVAGVQTLYVNKAYQNIASLSWPSPGIYTLYGGALVHVDVTPTYGGSSGAYVDFYNVPCSPGCFPWDFDVSTITISY